MFVPAGKHANTVKDDTIATENRWISRPRSTRVAFVPVQFSSGVVDFNLPSSYSPSPAVYFCVLKGLAATWQGHLQPGGVSFWNALPGPLRHAEAQGRGVLPQEQPAAAGGP